MTAATDTSSGRVSQVLGAVVDVEFPDCRLPPIFTALKVTNTLINDKPDNLTLEVKQGPYLHVEEKEHF